jgi:hypothetical protein
MNIVWELHQIMIKPLVSHGDKVKVQADAVEKIGFFDLHYQEA